MDKSKLQIAYSLLVLLIVPILIAFNTILLATSVRSNYDKELQSRAELSNSVFALSVQDLLLSDEKAEAKEKIDKLAASQNELKNVAVISKGASSYEVFAANSGYEISSSDALQFDIVYSRNWPVAKSVNVVSDSGNKVRAWNVASPIVDDANNVIGLITSNYLTADVDEKFDSTLDRSMIIMVISVIAVTVLLFNHFKLIGYADLLRKQKEVNQTMGDFLSVATHELKAPMSIIKGYIANVIDGDFGEIPDKAKEQLNVSVSQTDRLNELVKDLLNVSRIEQGKLKFDMKNVNITEIIQIIVNTYNPIAKEKNIEIKFDVSQPQWVFADAGRVQEIFTNLIDNAVKYSNRGEITVALQQDGKQLTASVRDSGFGMTSEERERLFQRFYRIKNEKTKDVSGTGLGLWIIKQYIDKMGGSIRVDSLQGVGSEFIVKLKHVDAPQPQINEQ